MLPRRQITPLPRRQGAQGDAADLGAALDRQVQKQIVDLLFSKHAERGMTLVLVTHDQSLAQRCDRVVRLRSGRVDAEAPGKNRAGAV